MTDQKTLLDRALVLLADVRPGVGRGAVADIDTLLSDAAKAEPEGEWHESEASSDETPEDNAILHDRITPTRPERILRSSPILPSTKSSGHWWCDHCKREAMPIAVTYEEHHVKCGHAVRWIVDQEISDAAGEHEEKHIEIQKILNTLETEVKDLAGDVAALAHRLDGDGTPVPENYIIQHNDATTDLRYMIDYCRIVSEWLLAQLRILRGEDKP